MWYYTQHNGLAHLWSLNDPTPYSSTPVENHSNLLIELDSQIRDVISNNNLLRNKINEILAIINEHDNMEPITAEELLAIIGGDNNG